MHLEGMAMIRGLALSLTVLTGFCGLVYEVAWQKYLATLLGSQSEATAAVLALFLGGLALGYALFGRVAARLTHRGGDRRALLRTYGLVEAGIGLWAWAFPWLFAAVQALSLALPHAAQGLGFAFDVALAALLVLPAAVLMGGTVPILTQALARDLGDATRFHAFVYAFNTAGAFLGALAAGFYLVPALGLRSTVLAMGAVNVTAGAAFVLLGGRRASRAPRIEASPPRAARRPEAVAGFGTCALVAFLSGFAMMTVQIVLNRLGAMAFGASHFTFAMVVATFVLCIALGSFAVAALGRIPRLAPFVAQAALVVALALLYLALEDTPYWAHELRRRFGHEAAAFRPFWFAAFGWLLAVMALPIGLSGAGLPLLFHLLRRQVSDLGQVAGKLYAWNTAGSVCGALVGGYALLFWLDLHHVYRLAVGALAVGSVLLGSRLLRPRGAALAGVVAVVLTAGLALLPRWAPLRLSSGPFRSRAVHGPLGAGPDAFFAGYAARVTVPFYDDDPTTSVAVWEGRKRGAVPSRAVVVNGKSDSEIPGDYTTTILIGLLPALVAAGGASAFVVGYGTGVTAGELARLPSMQRVDVAEISGGVLRAAPFFDYGNQGASSNPKLHLQRADAYRALGRSTRRYDVITSEPSNPWVAGVEMLYSREFLGLARSRLAPGGVYAQWIHLYDSDRETVGLVLRTFQSVFDDVAVWYALGEDLVLLGFVDGGTDIDLDRLGSRVRSPAFAPGLDRAGIHGVPALLAHELLPRGVLRAAADRGEVHTLGHPKLADAAARAFFRHGKGELPPTWSPAAAAAGRRASLLRRWLAGAAGGARDSLRLQAVAETFEHRPHEGAALLAGWEVEAPGSPLLPRAIEVFWRDRRLHEGLTPSDYALLVALAGRPAAVDCTALERAAALFAAYYHHAAPFDPIALDAACRRCPQGEAVRARLATPTGTFAP
jgi:predicted membrane-bound spermidine synthase